MAQSLNIFRALLLAFTASVTVHAYSDPTRPPAEFMPKAEGTPAAGPAVSAPVEWVPTLTLQSVIMSPGRQRAIISGESLAVGESLGNVRLIKLTETQAILQGPRGPIILELTPGIRKTDPAARKAASPSKSSKSGTPRPHSGDTQQ